MKKTKQDHIFNHKILFYSLLKEDYNTFIQKLFDYNSIINETNNDGETLLHYCSYYGLIDRYYAIINMGGIKTKTKKGYNLLHYASLSGKDDFMIIELVKNGISPIEKNIFGESSIHLAKNQRIAHYFNIWCKLHQIDIHNIVDRKNNNVYESSKAYNHHETSEYWITVQPELNRNKKIHTTNQQIIICKQ